jgi:RNA polymerase sigma-70 factor (sigma-E family)
MTAAADSQNEAGTSHVELTPVETFPTMFRREYPGLVTLAWALTGSRETAEDIAQDAMVALYHRWDDLSSITNPSAYLRRICMNKAASSFRRRAAEVRALLRLTSQTAATQTLPEEAEIFWVEVRRLPKRQAQVVALYYGCDMSVEQVSETLGMAAGTVKSHLNRGRHTLSRRFPSSESSEEVAT